MFGLLIRSTCETNQDRRAWQWWKLLLSFAGTLMRKKTMIEVILVVRDPVTKKIEYSLTFDLPHLPRVGDYISVKRPDARTTEDLIVRHLMWTLHHGDTGDGEGKNGGLTEIQVECDPALGPYCGESWRTRWEGVAGVEYFDLRRIVL